MSKPAEKIPFAPVKSTGFGSLPTKVIIELNCANMSSVNAFTGGRSKRMRAMEPTMSSRTFDVWLIALPLSCLSPASENAEGRSLCIASTTLSTLELKNQLVSRIAWRRALSIRARGRRIGGRGEPDVEVAGLDDERHPRERAAAP